ncbi:MAG: FemAB family XrtA/PEP-CTERM system-associated protein [Gammaproteobacteria bacterium]
MAIFRPATRARSQLNSTGIGPAPGPGAPGESAPQAAWDACVLAHPRATLYHSWRWSEFAGEVFGFPVHRLTVPGDAGTLAGVLALVEQRSLLAGNRLVSLPYFNYGGALGRSAEIERQLMAQARDRARERRIAALEVRDTVPREGAAMRTDKAAVELLLPASAEELSRSLDSKLRSQIRRADRESPAVTIGGADLIDDFYAIFAATMRDLGTPVYPHRFFSELMRRLAADCSIVLVSLHGRPAAAALLTHFRDRTEIPWAASLHELRATAVNMRLYWECLAHAIGRGSRVFDFGRSTVDSGSYRFKLQWGGKPRPLYWIYPLATSAPAAGHGRLMDTARSVWSRLPLRIANRLGPWISPGLPW